MNAGKCENVFFKTFVELPLRVVLTICKRPASTVEATLDLGSNDHRQQRRRKQNERSECFVSDQAEPGFSLRNVKCRVIVGTGWNINALLFIFAGESNIAAFYFISSSA